MEDSVCTRHHRRDRQHQRDVEATTITLERHDHFCANCTSFLVHSRRSVWNSRETGMFMTHFKASQGHMHSCFFEGCLRT